MDVEMTILRGKIAMLFTTAHLPKTKANKAAAEIYCTAVVLAELPAAFVSFQWHQPTFPPTQNVDSAVSPVPAARQFSGNYAQIAAFFAICA